MATQRRGKASEPEATVPPTDSKDNNIDGGDSTGKSKATPRGFCSIKLVFIVVLLVLGGVGVLYLKNKYKYILNPPISLGRAVTADEAALEASYGIARPVLAAPVMNPKLMTKVSRPKSIQPINLHTDEGVFRYKTGVKAAAEYLLRNNDADGFFVYQWNAIGKYWQKDPGYNILRHAGTIYSLTEACGVGATSGHRMMEGLPCEEARKTMVTAVEWLIRETIGVVPGSAGRKLACYCQWKYEYPNPELNTLSRRRREQGDIERGVVKLGAMGLGLVAISNVGRVLEEEGKDPQRAQRYKRLVEGLATFVVEDMVNQTTGLFHVKLNVNGEKIEVDPIAVSLYYPGEAALGLVTAFEFTQNQLYLTASFDSLLALSRSRISVSEMDIPDDHWALIATAAIMEHSIVQQRPEETKVLLDHAAKVVRSMYRKVLLRYKGRQVGSSSIGTILEGVFAILPHLQDRDDLSLNMPDGSSITAEGLMCFTGEFSSWLMSGQATAGPLAIIGALPNRFTQNVIDAPDKETGDLRAFYTTFQSGQFKPQNYRVDDTQHGMSGIITMLRNMEKLNMRAACTEAAPGLAKITETPLLPTVIFPNPALPDIE